ncbi:DUF4351 domain-containing protein [Heliorestis convoluta]|uniref:DUF4351 domain-containing protein n=1 Tax=Heliorestis convoluta TaxID=356322 RepID=A0A5Q2N096_9FIRM|nr:DUF4351 domain-containing protein [Heliorestis convoluta]QGG47701.1 hypothetical protein FTV88_1601 [Heliorestis convoluta]
MKKAVVFITQSKARSERTGNQYDTTLKEIFEDSSEAFIQFFTGQNYKLEETMTIEFPKTENRRADGVFLISSTEGEMVCHIEFQSSNDSTIPYRMLRYALEIHQRKELPVCLAGIVHEDSLVKKVFAEVDKMINLQESSTYRRIIKEGKKEALTEILLHQLNVKFGKLPESYVEQIEKQDYDVLEVIAGRIFELDKPEDLDKYLN